MVNSFSILLGLTDTPTFISDTYGKQKFQNTAYLVNLVFNFFQISEVEK